MQTVFVDSNVFLRFLTMDDVIQQQKADALFVKARKRKIVLVTGPPVFFEIAWTLRSIFDYPRERVLLLLDSLAALDGLSILDRDIVSAALNLARRTNQDFADAYIAVSAAKAGADSIATFNRRHFEKLGIELFPL